MLTKIESLQEKRYNVRFTPEELTNVLKDLNKLLASSKHADTKKFVELSTKRMRLGR
jgi:hypothetical protein